MQAALGELAATAGDTVAALDYLIPAQLTGTAPKEATDALRSIYRSQHNNSADGFEAFLDSEYHRRLPNPVTPDPWRAPANRSDRVVLAEVFTGSGCPPCAAADLAFEAALARYPRRDFAVLMYHEHIPRPDPHGQSRHVRTLQKFRHERRSDLRHRRPQDRGRRTA